MLVLCVGMYRSCSTWQYGVASLILERHRQGRRLGFIEGARFAELSLADPPVGDHGTWQVMKAHDAHPSFDQVLHDGRALGIFAYRDVRDVAQSWMHMTGASFEAITTGGFLDLCLSNDRFWRSRPSVLVQPYERIVSEPLQAVREIADHLGVPIGDDEVQAIADAMSRESNRKRIDALNARLQTDGTNLVPQDLSLFDPNSLLHWNHIRDGRSGIWREQFSPDQCRVLGKLCGPWLVDRGYEPDLAWSGLDPAGPDPDLPRISYAEDHGDVRLCRILGGSTGTYLDLGPTHPTDDNLTQFFSHRGWHGVNVVESATVREQFRADRPEDLTLAIRLDAEDTPPTEADPTPSTRSLAGLARQYLLSRPDLVVIRSDTSDAVESILGGLPWDVWQPRALVVRGEAEATPPWEASLRDRGYARAFAEGSTCYYVRAEDVETTGAELARPFDRSESFERGDLYRMRADRDRLAAQIQADAEAHAEALAQLAATRDAERDLALQNLNDERTASILGLIGERDYLRSLADGHAAERDWLRGELQIARDRLTESHQLRLGEHADRAAEQAARADEQADRVAEQVAWHVERVASRSERDQLAAALDALRSRLAAVEAERDDLRLDCATWEAEATRRARQFREDRSAHRGLSLSARS